MAQDQFQAVGSKAAGRLIGDLRPSPQAVPEPGRCSS